MAKAKRTIVNGKVILNITCEQWEYDEFVAQEDPTVTIAECGGTELKNTRISYACNCEYDCHTGFKYSMNDENVEFIVSIHPDE